MELQLIRNATLRLAYAGRTLLVDPYLAEPGTLPPYRGRSPNPLVPLPCPAAEVVAGVELGLVSHLHRWAFRWRCCARRPCSRWPIWTPAPPRGRARGDPAPL